ncbi:hypothetical protein PENARI_c019G09139 [Penicillium arizonense]|uniref:Uncharacterized protein n=1 Tax=Penicillium arizonense TaxID=1835702 RepID=A0A1F5LA59_PENAI|nr:hypothetical protein PENARI_c019G09139 [Penicillium arizonense]OGE49791.1 hypothetical protein PENARI_c019G09139 [Penicillium arizonense]
MATDHGVEVADPTDVEAGLGVVVVEAAAARHWALPGMSDHATSPEMAVVRASADNSRESPPKSRRGRVFVVPQLKATRR